MDQDGFAQFAAAKNVAHRARVTPAEAEEALHILENPDPDSSNPDNEGRRIERVPGGWIVLNADKHRSLVTTLVNREQNKIRVQRHRDKKRDTITSALPTITSNGSEAEAEAEAHSETEFPVTKKDPERKAAAVTKANGNGHNARSKHPIFAGQRFVVFDWMLEDIGRTLGSHLDDFDIHQWFFDLDVRAGKEALVKSKNDWWPWIQNELVTEAEKRGLPVAKPKKMGVTPKTAGNAAALDRFLKRHGA